MRTIDFIGIVHHCGSVKEKTLRSGQSKPQRTILVTDESNNVI
jgi:hypothetical protein